MAKWRYKGELPNAVIQNPGRSLEFRFPKKNGKKHRVLHTVPATGFLPGDVLLLPDDAAIDRALTGDPRWEAVDSSAVHLTTVVESEV